MPKITIQNQLMHYEEYGEGKAILFGHSFLWDKDMWQEQVAMLSKHYRCIVPDLWGHGESALLETNKVSLADLSSDHLALMDALGIGKFSIIGLSVGGMWAAHIAAKHPDRVEKLVLCDTDLGKEPLLKKLKYFFMIKIMEKANAVPPKLIEKVVPIFFSQKTLDKNHALVSYFKAKLLAIKQENIPTIAALARAIFWRDNFLNELKNIKAETKIIVGENDIARPPHEAKRLASLISGATLSIIENAGHIPACEEPEAVNKILKDFFKI